MPNRREFLTQTAVVGVSAGMLVTTGIQPVVAVEKSASSTSAAKDSALAATSLRILILGGTGFIGTHFVKAALHRGHKVSVFSRGKKTSAELQSGVEQLIGDRSGDLESIKHRDWDAVIDIATYVPNEVRTLGQAIKDRVKHYTFISSVAVYDNTDEGNEVADEHSKLLEYSDAAEAVYQYGGNKVLCEREAEKQFPGKALMVRPTVIVGPNDGGGAFTYLCARMEAGGEMLVAGEPLMPMQLIDVRDLTEWMIRLVEKGETGAVNAAGPAMQLTWAEMLGAIRGLSSVPVKLTWVPVAWLKERKVSTHSDLLFWPTGNGKAGLHRVSTDMARAKGLTFRPTFVSAADTLAWYKSLPAIRQTQVLWPSDEQHRSLEDSMARERQLLKAWHGQNTE